MNKPAPLYGLILNGGASSRMGMPKGDIAYHHQPQKQYLFALLSQHCDAVFCSVKTKDTSHTIPQIMDQLTIKSPLNGIYSALKSAPDHAWLVVPNDMPLITDATISNLIYHRNPSRIATCYLDATGTRPEPLLSIWEPAVLLPMEEFIRKGGESPREFLESNPTHVVSIDETETLLNINSREELIRFRKRNQKS